MSLDSDVKLVPGQVVLDSWDLCLDSPDRRKADVQTPHRRALVHGPGDGLVVNWGNDYPDGITLNAVHRVTGHNNVIPKGTLFEDHLHARKSVRFTRQGHDGSAFVALDAAGRLAFDQPKHAAPGVQFNVPVNVHTVISESPPLVWDYELSEELLRISKVLNELRERIEKLEQQPNG